MAYVPKHSQERKDEQARQEFYADYLIWDHEFDDPYEPLPETEVKAEAER